MTVLITGASGGLGRAFAAECASRGYNLYLTDINEAGLAEIKQGLERQYDVQVAVRVCDLTDQAQVKDMFDDINEQGIKLNMLLGVAGLDFEGGFIKRDFDQIINIVNTNIAATLRVTHAALKHRDNSERFNVVIVSSLASQYPIPLKATYAASKRFPAGFLYSAEAGAFGRQRKCACAVPGRTADNQPRTERNRSPRLLGKGDYGQPAAGCAEDYRQGAQRQEHIHPRRSQPLLSVPGEAHAKNVHRKIPLRQMERSAGEVAGCVSIILWYLRTAYRAM